MGELPSTILADSNYRLLESSRYERSSIMDMLGYSVCQARELLID